MDATFWVAVSFVIFFGFLIYKKIPGMIASSLDDKISEITKKIDEAEKLKLESEQLLSKYQNQLDHSKIECDEILSRASKMNEEESIVMEEKIKQNKLHLQNVDIVGGALNAPWGICSKEDKIYVSNLGLRDSQLPSLLSLSRISTNQYKIESEWISDGVGLTVLREKDCI